MKAAVRGPGLVSARRLPHWHALGAALLLCLGVPAAHAQAAGIYTCVDASGRKLTSDRPILDCISREQQQLNRDGSLRRVVPPTPTADERAEAEARDRRLALQKAAQADAVRRDRNLLARYPDEAAHQRARAAALDPVRQAMQTGEKRVRQLAAERKPLLEEAEFFKGRTLPPKLKAALDANDASVEAQRDSAAGLESELARINRLYDSELDRLRLLWAGAAPGSVPAASAAPAPTPAPKLVSQPAPAASKAGKR